MREQQAPPTHSIDAVALPASLPLAAGASGAESGRTSIDEGASAPGPRPDARRQVHAALRSDTEAEEHTANVLRLRKALTVGSVAVPAFVVADIAVQHYAFPQASIGWQLLLRVCSFLALFLGRERLRRQPAPSPRGLIALDTIAFGITSIGVSLSCLSFGGFNSHYASGLPLVLICRATLVHVPWRASLAPVLVSALSYPIAQLAPMLWSPAAAAQLHDPAALVIFCTHTLQILTTGAFVIVGGHSVWALRRKIFEARTIDRYRLLRPLGRGGMGEVWVARHATLRREVALKLLRVDRAHDGVAQRRFEREVQATMQLTHPNTVRVYDYGVTDDGLLYYAMELLDGRTLAGLVTEEGALGAEASVRIMAQVAAAVAEAHGLGIIHRDLKPENIFVCANASESALVKVLDFGLAKRTTRGAESALTEVERVLGTPQYMAPEVAVGGSADARSDVYALGAVLYFMLTGRPPFDGPTSTAVMIAHSQESPVPPSVVRAAELPSWLEQLVLRCLAKAPHERFADAGALLRALSEPR